MSEFKEVTYQVKLFNIMGFPFSLSQWKTRGSRWKPFTEAPDYLRKYLRSGNRDLVFNNMRWCSGDGAFICGEVTVKTPITRQAAWARRKKNNG